MSEEIKSINEFDYNLICEYFSLLERQGPGSEASTIKALSFIDGLTDNSRIADIGCGTGGQTMVLAQNAPGHITGIDLFQRFIDMLSTKASKLNLSDRVNGVACNMEDLPFTNGQLDMIWCEGAIYNIGFERGLKEWHKLLKDNGYIAVTEVSWLSLSRPVEIERFWMDAYPEIDTIARKIEIMQEAGYRPVACFVLPDECWTTNFYEPQRESQKIFLQRHKGNKFAEELVANEAHEASVYDKYKDYYGYVFYIGQKI